MAGFRKEALTGHYGFVRAAMEQMQAEGLGFRVARPSGLDRTFEPKY